MIVKVLSSGSKGNSTYIESNGTKILIDVGINFTTIKESLNEIGKDIYELDGILISHEHHDHISGLNALSKKVKAPIFVRKYLEKEVKKLVNDDLINIIDSNEKLIIGSFEIETFNNSHDVPNTGYIVSDNKSSLVYITDTGYINKKNIDKTINKDIYIIESNHDEEMLMNGPYPYMLKQRVIGDTGHLSNSSCTSYLKKVIGNNTKYIILAHISENNNTYDIAYNNACNELKDIFNKDNILIAYQHKGADIIEI